ncbi:MAG: hypothetical protein PHN31_01940, partial [Candidatus Gracilibacteria bacterium]|nr:hypothetical protein [Candidatus Gracilibacteria bacterium]
MTNKLIIKKYEDEDVLIVEDNFGGGGDMLKSTYDPTAKNQDIFAYSANPANVTQTSSYRFVSDTEKGVWNGKQAALGFTPEDALNKSNDVITDGSSTTKYSTVKSMKDYVDSMVAGLLDYRGAYNASVNTFPATGGSGTAGAIMKGDLFIISVAGTLGGIAIQIGDYLIANIDNPGQTLSKWDMLNTNVAYVPADDTAVVHNTGDETVAGIKTFTSNTILLSALIGSDANFTDFPGAKLVVAHSNTGHTYTGNLGLSGEAVASVSDTGTGIGGVACTNGANQGRGVAGVGKVSNSADTGASIGGYFRALDTHSGGINVGVSCQASGGSANYALSLAGGNISSLTNSLSWLLYDNQASPLTFSSTGKADILTLVTTDGAEGVTMSGTLGVTGTITTGGIIELGHASDTTISRVSAGLVAIEGVNIMTVGSADTVTGLKTLGTTGAIKLGSAVTDKCE